MLLPLLLLLACGPEPAPPEPVDPNAPRRYRVLRGDTLKTIASKRSCSPEDLVAWNDLGEDPLLVPGQILQIYQANYRPARPEIPNGDDREALPSRGSEPVVAAQPGDASSRPTTPRPTSPRPTTPRPVPASRAPEPVTAGTDPPPQQVVATRRPRPSKNGVEILSLLDDLGEPELEHVPSVRSSGRRPGEAALHGRDLGQGGTADPASVEIARPSAGPASSSSSAAGVVGVPRLPKASAKACLPVVLRDLGDKGMAAPAGLDRAAIRRGMAPIVSAAGGCLASGSQGSWEIHLEVTVGCDGLVYRADVVMDGGLPRDITRCVAEVAKQGSFDAAQGVTPFVYPIRFSGG